MRWASAPLPSRAPRAQGSQWKGTGPSISSLLLLNFRSGAGQERAHCACKGGPDTCPELPRDEGWGPFLETSRGRVWAQGRKLPAPLPSRAQPQGTWHEVCGGRTGEEAALHAAHLAAGQLGPGGGPGPGKALARLCREGRHKRGLAGAQAEASWGQCGHGPPGTPPAPVPRPDGAGGQGARGHAGLREPASCLLPTPGQDQTRCS